IFVYYVLLWSSRDLAYGGRIPANWAPWIPNILLGAFGIGLTIWRSRMADQPIRISVPMFWRRLVASDGAPAAGVAGAPTAARRDAVIVLRIPHVNIPRPGLLDLYISRQYVRVFLL